MPISDSVIVLLRRLRPIAFVSPQTIARKGVFELIKLNWFLPIVDGIQV